jgi:hypothetical protein
VGDVSSSPFFIFALDSKSSILARLRLTVKASPSALLFPCHLSRFSQSSSPARLSDKMSVPVSDDANMRTDLSDKNRAKTEFQALARLLMI